MASENDDRAFKSYAMDLDAFLWTLEEPLKDLHT